MNKYLRLLIPIILYLISCNKNENNYTHPLAGSYKLKELIVHTKLAINFSQYFYYINDSSDKDSMYVKSGTIVRDDTLIFTNKDENPISGEATFNSNGEAVLIGSLPTNIGTPCDPILVIFKFASDGNWEADDSSFTLDLYYDLAEDINGSYIYNEDSGLLAVDYTIINRLDSIRVDSLYYNNNWIYVESVCLQATSTINRILKMIKE